MDGQFAEDLAPMSAQPVRLSYFGVFRARREDGETVEISSTKTRALLAYLALAPGMRHSREHLAALLWDRSDHEHARASLRQAIAGLRKAFGDNSDRYLTADSAEIVGLNPDLFNLDMTPAAKGGPFHRTDFLADLNIRSEPFEEWRRERAASLETSIRSENNSAGPLPVTPPQLSAVSPSPQDASTIPASLASPAPSPTPGRRFAGYVIGAIALAGAVFVGGAYINAGGKTEATLPPSSQTVTDTTRQAAALRNQPQLADAIEGCRFDRTNPETTVSACTTVIDGLDNSDLYKATALTMRGTAYRWQAKYDAAKEDFARATIIDPSYYNAHHNLAYSYYLSGDYEQALAHYQRVKELNPAHVMAHYRTGEVYSKLEDHPNAVKAFTETLELSPRSAHAYFYRAKSSIALGDTEAAKDDLRMAASLSSVLRTEAQMLHAELSEED